MINTIATPQSDCLDGTITVEATAENSDGTIEYQVHDVRNNNYSSWQPGNLFEGLAAGEYRIGVRWQPNNSSEFGCSHYNYTQNPVIVNFDPNGCGATCSDNIRNGDETGVDCGGSQCPPCDNPGSGNCITQDIDSQDFENDMGIWNSGGSSAGRGYNRYVNSGEYGIFLSGNSDASTITTNNLDLSTYQGVSLSFSYFPFSMSYSYEDFWLQISIDGGTSFTTIADWKYQTDFQNGTIGGEKFQASISYNGTLSSTVQFRFRADFASGRNGGWAVIDDIVIGGCLKPTCSDGLQNGDESGVDCGGSSCNACPTCQDGIQNGTEEGIDCGGNDCGPCSTCAFSLLHESDFESNWGIWIDGGTNAKLQSNSNYSNSGYSSVQIGGNTISSQITTSTQDFDRFESIEVQFFYVAVGMDNSSEGFLLELSTDNGQTYSSIQEWYRNSNFQNYNAINETVVLFGPFSSQTKLRFRTIASSTYDRVYLDDIKLSTCVREICGNQIDDDGDGLIDDEDEECGPADFEFELTEDDCTAEINVYDGSIDIIIPIGIAATDYLYKLEGQISGSFQGDPFFDNLPAGEYEVYSKSIETSAISKLNKVPLFVPCNIEVCDNLIDDDNDGLLDCEDDDCPSCSNEDCIAIEDCVEYQADDSTNAESTGIASLFIAGKNSDSYIISWQGPTTGQNSFNCTGIVKIENLPAGTYQFFLEQGNCRSQCQIEISSVVGNGTNFDCSQVLNENNLKDLFTAQDCEQWVGISGNTSRTINRLGKVGIGLSQASVVPSGFNLAVKGGIITDEVIVELCENGGWCDYVFEESYHLWPLKKVRKYIRKKGTLPNTTSQEDVDQTGGINLREVKLNQQEKVEEIFLHLIEMNKRVQQLREQVKALRLENEELKSK